MADDLSFTISAKDQASHAVETVQKKIQDFGKDVAKMALGVAGPMALIQEGFAFAKSKIDEYKQSLIDAKNTAVELANASIAAGKALTPGQAFAKQEADFAKQEKEAKAEDVTGKMAVKESLKLNRKDYIDEFIKINKLTGEEAENYKHMSNSKLSENEKFFAFVYQKLQEQLNLENELSQAELKRIKDKADAEKKRAAEKAAEEKLAEKQRSRTETLTEQLKSVRAEFEHGGPLEGKDLINQLTEQRDKAKGLFDFLNVGENKGKAAALEAELKYKQAEIALRREQKKQDEIANQNANKPPEIKEAKLTVSSLREIGGSFGGGDVATGIETQIELARKTVDVLSVIADNTAPKSDAGESKPVGGTNFTGSAEDMAWIKEFIWDNK